MDSRALKIVQREGEKMNASKRNKKWLVFFAVSVVVLPLLSRSFLAGIETAVAGVVLSAILWLAYILPAERAEDKLFDLTCYRGSR